MENTETTVEKVESVLPPTNALEWYKQVSGRDIKDINEAKQHFENLSKLAFGKEEKFKEKFQKEADSVLEQKIKELTEEKEKEAKPFKDFINDIGLDLTKVNPLEVASAIKEYLGEQHEDIKPRVEAKDEKAELQDLEKRAKRGEETARRELTKRMVYGNK